MRARLHHFLLSCDGCDKRVIVIHEGPEQVPDGWGQFPDTIEDRPGTMLDFCPKCVKKWEENRRKFLGL